MHLQLGKMRALMAPSSESAGEPAWRRLPSGKREASMGVCREHAEKAPKTGAGTQVVVEEEATWF